MGRVILRAHLPPPLTHARSSDMSDYSAPLADMRFALALDPDNLMNPGKVI